MRNYHRSIRVLSKLLDFLREALLFFTCFYRVFIAAVEIVELVIVITIVLVRRYCENFCFRAVKTKQASSFLVLFYSIGKLFERKSVFSRVARIECTFCEGIKFQRSRTCVPDKKGRLSRLARAWNSDKSIPTIPSWSAGRSWRGEGNFCDRAIILSASLKDRTNRNTGRFWRCYVCECFSRV